MKLQLCNHRVFSGRIMSNLRSDWKERWHLYRNLIGADTTMRSHLLSLDVNDCRDLIDELQKYIAWQEVN